MDESFKNRIQAEMKAGNLAPAICAAPGCPIFQSGVCIVSRRSEAVRGVSGVTVNKVECLGCRKTWTEVEKG